MENTALTEFTRVDETFECAEWEAWRDSEDDARDTLPCPPPSEDDDFPF